MPNETHNNGEPQMLRREVVQSYLQARMAQPDLTPEDYLDKLQIRIHREEFALQLGAEAHKLDASRHGMVMEECYVSVAA